MLKAALAGAFALAVAGSSLAIAETTGGNAAPAARAAIGGGPVVTVAHIARLKSVLKLTAEQEPYWPPVEAALRDIARQQMQRLRSRASTIALDAAAVRRLMVTALPLIVRLNDDQKRHALAMTKAMGFAVASAM
jgi:hypothetical protein